MKAKYLRDALIILIGTIVVVSVAFALPTYSYAASSGLVVCGVGSDIGSATECQACHIFALIDTVARFILFLAVPIATLLFAYAGFLYFTQGVHGHSEGKAIFRDALLGFVFVLCGFLIVDTIIKTLANGQFVGPSWNTVQCVPNSSRQITSGGLGFNYDNLPAGLFDPASAPRVNPTIGTGNCSPSAMSGDWGANASRMSCVVQGESGCVYSRESGVDKDASGVPFSYGLYQINLTANSVQCPGQAPLNCPSAYSGTNYKARIVNQPLFEQCKAAATNKDCATLTAQQILAKQGWGAWSAYSSNGCGRL